MNNRDPTPAASERGHQLAQVHTQREISLGQYVHPFSGEEKIVLARLDAGQDPEAMTDGFYRRR